MQELDIEEMEELSLEVMSLLSRDVSEAAELLPHDQARWLVDEYYTYQESRKRAKNQERSRQAESSDLVAMLFKNNKSTNWALKLASSKDRTDQETLVAWLREPKHMEFEVKRRGHKITIKLPIEKYDHDTSIAYVHTEIAKAISEPSALITFISKQHAAVERILKGALGMWAAQYAVGQWIQALNGFGPVLSAGMLSNFDIRKAPTVGHFWSFAGLSPHIVWEKGKKRPYNAALKSMCAYKVGETQIKFQNHAANYYGRMMILRKNALAECNERLEFRPAAEAGVSRVGKATEAYKHYSEGKLPPAQIHARARRWGVKLFISHLHSRMYEDWHGRPAPDPYCFRDDVPGDHRHMLDDPLKGQVCDGKGLREMYGD